MYAGSVVFNCARRRINVDAILYQISWQDNGYNLGIIIRTDFVRISKIIRNCVSILRENGSVNWSHLQ